MKIRKKELSELEKQAKTKEKLQQKVDRERKKLYEIERERNTIEERLNSTKRLDELEDDEGRLKRLYEEDQAVIDDICASEFDKEAARERMAARDEELLQIKAQISERENSLSLQQRIKQIFKKYGVTVTAIFLAAGVTIGAVIGAITNALKKTRNRFVKWAQKYWSKSRFCTAWANRCDRQLPFQNRRTGNRLSSRANLATYFRSGCFHF